LTEAHDPDLLNVLVAYPYATPPMLTRLAEYKESIRFVLDSGAFTAWKAGKPIDLDDYCRFLDRLPVKPWRYFLLDVIGDPKGTLRNYEIMLKRGYSPVPIFTRGEDPSILNDFYKSSDVVAVGGLVGTRGNKGFVNGIMRHIGKRRVHWLGFTVPEYILHYRPYMCDSSSFDSPLRFGKLKLYIGRGKMIDVQAKDFIRKPPQKILDAVRFYTEDPHSLATKSEWVNSGKNKTTLERLTYKSAVAMYRELSSRSGTLIFFACTAEWKIPSLHFGLKFTRKAFPHLFTPQQSQPTAGRSADPLPQFCRSTT
jgi:hypothetical protein